MNWVEFFDANFIHYVTGGKNTARNWVSIKCPFCGVDDPSEHAGCHPSGAWSCWRNAAHKGSKPDRLISALLNVSGPQARLIAQSYTRSSPDDFGLPQATTTPRQAQIKPVEWPPEFESVTGKFLHYLISRGFDESTAEYYNLACCQTGRWKYRLIIPVFDAKSRLLGWQGRAIVEPKKAPRYLTSHPQVKRTLFNLQNLQKGGDCLYICEGPMNALKLDYFGKPKIRATCTFGVSFTPDQIMLLSELGNRFKHTLILFDPDGAGIPSGFSLSDWLPKAEFGKYLDEDDPGMMDKDQIMRYLYEHKM